MSHNDAQIVEAIKRQASPLNAGPFAPDYRKLVNQLGGRDFYLLGESSHGSTEFYQTRIAITKQLIHDQALSAIAIEGDWPSAYRVNRYVRWQGNDKSAIEALGNFQRFPLWMWRNTVTLKFVEWLRRHNENLPREQQVGFYGLDMYSMYESMAAVLEYLDQVDPPMAVHARGVYACLDHVNSPQSYGHGVNVGLRPSCEPEVIRLLMAMREKSLSYAKHGDVAAEDDLFEAEQNARLVRSAESYYRQMFDTRANTWNLRDSHMMETLENLQSFLSRHRNAPARIAVWAHNSHVGDARATHMGARDEHNLGQLVRERVEQKQGSCALIGLTTHTGSVTAASDWDAPAQCKRVRPSVPNSIEALFHATGMKCFMLMLEGEIAPLLERRYLQRAIGVLYLPHSERSSHYFHAQIARQFDWVIHIDTTTALEPLDPVSEWYQGEEQTYPFGV